MTQQNSFTGTLSTWVAIISSASALVITIFTSISSLRVEMAIQREQLNRLQTQTTGLADDVERIDKNVLVLEKAIEQTNPSVVIRNENGQP